MITSTNQSKLISIDYDQTFTTDPVLWLEFIRFAKSRGHRVICVTMRFEINGNEVKDALYAHVEKIIFTGNKPKAERARELGYPVDIWIDDLPWLI